MGARRRFGSLRATVISPLALACAEPRGTVGEHVEVRSAVVERVCQGTVAQLDAEVERIAAELELPVPDERIIVEVLEPSAAFERCASVTEGCMTQPPRRVYVPADDYDDVARFELARAVLDEGLPRKTKALMFEGLAAATSFPSCAPAREDYPWPPASVLLTAGRRDTLGSDGRYVGGELLRWLLDTHGPGPVIGWAAELGYDAPLHEVQASYAARFGGDVHDELFAHFRPDDAALDPGRAGCLAPAPEPGDSPRELRLRAELDCASPRVHNDFDQPEEVFVEWTLAVEPGRDGVWTLASELPEQVRLTVSRCGCYAAPWSSLLGRFDLPWAANGRQSLDVGRYRVRAHGPIGASLDVRLLTACDVRAQDCPNGTQCVLGACLVEADDPVGLGQACGPTWGLEPVPCEPGLVCVGANAADGECVPACGGAAGPACADSEVCMVGFACVPACDPLAPDACPPGEACEVGYDEPGCLPRGTAGLLEPCTWLECGPGLTCEPLPVALCEDPEQPGEWRTCCTPLCDPTAAPPDCPPELPRCDAFEAEPGLGRCNP